jgi:hypothetical protein
MLKQILLKRTALGIYAFEINHIYTAGNPIIQTRYGLLDGNKTSYNTYGTVKQYEAIINKKRKEGYKSNVDLGLTFSDNGGLNLYNLEDYNKLLPEYNTDLNNFYKPMKCQPFQPNKFIYDALGQPKINGGRINTRWGKVKDGLFSEPGVVITTHEGVEIRVAHIEAVMKDVFKYCDSNIVFDGEIYKYGELVTSINGAARNPRNPIHPYLQFHCFDLAIPDVHQNDRITIKDEIFRRAYYPSKVHKQINVQDHIVPEVVVNVYTKLIHSDEEATEFRTECIDAGYEGCVIRNMVATYRFGSRPMTMMKLKKPKYGTFKVLDMIPFGFENTENDIGKGIKFILKNDLTDATWECNATGTVSEKTDAMNNKKRYIGDEVIVSYFERTATNLPFHANVILNKK